LIVRNDLQQVRRGQFPEIAAGNHAKPELIAEECKVFVNRDKILPRTHEPGQCVCRIRHCVMTNGGRYPGLESRGRHSRQQRACGDNDFVEPRFDFDKFGRYILGNPFTGLGHGISLPESRSFQAD
jgi:hypothetical protein